MEQNTVSLQDKISRAEQYYQELCDYQKRHKYQLQSVIAELEAIQKSVNNLFVAIVSSTRNTHVGAPQALGALKSVGGHLNVVYELLEADVRFNKIGGDYGSLTKKSIQVTPGLATKQRRLAELCEQVAVLSRKTQEHARTFKEKNLRSNDLVIYSERVAEGARRISQLGQAMEILTEMIGQAAQLYSGAKVNAIERANQIPY